MQPFTVHKGLVAPLDAVNVDTDQIIPKQFLKRIERTGFGQFLFFDWRFLDNGAPNPNFSLNLPRYQGATILLARNNFGCGSSREHAPWALLDYGFRAVIAPSFADIFKGNCYKNGILPVELHEKTVDGLFYQAESTSGYKLTIDLDAQVVLEPDGTRHYFDIDPVRKHFLYHGLDDIGWTLQFAEDISRFEANRQPFV